jgi:hypothetical protein
MEEILCKNIEKYVFEHFFKFLKSKISKFFLSYVGGGAKLKFIAKTLHCIQKLQRKLHLSTLAIILKIGVRGFFVHKCPENK